MKYSEANFFSIVTLGGMAFFQITNFLLGIFIVRYLGVSELGFYQYFIATTTFLAFFAKMGGDERLSYILPSIGGFFSAEGRSLVFNVLFKSIFNSLLISIAFVLIQLSIFSVESNTKFFIESTSIILYLPSFVGVVLLASVLRAEHRIFARSVFLYIAPNILNFLFIPILGIWILYQNASIAGRTLTYFILFLFIFLFLKIRFLPFEKKRKSRRENTEINDYQWLFVSVVSYVLETGLIALWVGKYILSAEDFGVFTVLLRLSALIMLVPASILIVYGPILAKAPYDVFIRKKIFSYNLLGTAVAFIGLILFSDLFLSLFGNDYIFYDKELLILSFGIFFLAITQPMYGVLLAIKKKELIYIPGILVIITGLLSLIVINIISLQHLINYSVFLLLVYSLVRSVVFIYPAIQENKNA